MSKLRVDFIDNASSQYDANAARIKLKNFGSLSLFLGDQSSCSFVQVKARKIRRAICCSRELMGFCKEKEVQYLFFDPDDCMNKESELKKLKDFLDAAVAGEQPLLVFCESGISKSAFVVAYLAMQFDRAKLSEIVKQMETSRGALLKLKPSLANSLLEMERKLTGSATMEYDGKNLRPKAGIRQFPSKTDKSKNSGTSGQGAFYALTGAIVFFAIVYGVLYSVTGKM